MPEKNQASTPTSITNWAAFEKAALNPTEIVCVGHKPFHAHDSGCHSRVIPKPENIAFHIAGEHGGGFDFSLVPAQGKVWNGWDALAKMQLEIQDLTCGICNHPVRVHTQALLNHMKTHLNGNRKRVPGGLFRITIGTNIPEKLAEDDELVA